MWLPGPIYESLPYLYIIGGVLFISGTLYMGVTSSGAALYIACGLLSIVYVAYMFAASTLLSLIQKKEGRNAPLLCSRSEN
jgi:hypothetical protein